MSALNKSKLVPEIEKIFLNAKNVISASSFTFFQNVDQQLKKKLEDLTQSLGKAVPGKEASKHSITQPGPR